MKRIENIDGVRGIVMMIMALDHVRDLLHVNSIIQSPTNLETTTPVLFFTRWITYLCAPVFVFLAGTSAYLSCKKHHNDIQSKSFLIKRGIYLIMLEFIVVNLALFFDMGYHTLLFEVIASTGFGFIILGLLLKLPVKTLGIIGLLIICCHNLAPAIPLPETSGFKKILMPLFAPSALSFSNRTFVVGYPPIPWLGIMLVGFASGAFFELSPTKRKHLFLKIGAGALCLFILIRLINVYGDSVPWSFQKNSLYTFLSFMNVTKYPPSLVFCLVTLGIMFLGLAITEQANGWFVNVSTVYGKAPLFYFLLHFFFIHLILLGILLLQGFSWSTMDFVSGNFGRPKTAQSGVALWAVYVIWILVVLVLYKPCKWFGEYKLSHKHWWLRYM